MNHRKTFQDCLAENIDEVIGSASDQEIRKEAEESGDDIVVFGERMRIWLDRVKDDIAENAIRESIVAV